MKWKYLFFPAIIVLVLIRLYQKTISPDHGILKTMYPNGFCRFYPTCSEYGYQAIQKHGLIIGGILTIKRILRCNPCHSGGIDEVPKIKRRR